MKRLDLFGLLKKDMNFIEEELYRSIDSTEPLINDTSLHLLKAGGKRLQLGICTAGRQVWGIRSGQAQTHSGTAGTDSFCFPCSR